MSDELTDRVGHSPGRTPGESPGLVSFVIPVRNDARGLRRCLRSIRDAGGPSGPFELIVADNGSEDSSAEVGREEGARVLDLPGIPVSALRNRAAAQAQGQILAFVDADHEIEAGWLEAAREAFVDARVGAVGAPYMAPPSSSWVQTTYDALRDHRPGRREVEWLGSGNLAVRRKAFDRVGGFDESLVTCEDVDLCARLRRRGYRILGDSRLRSIHYGDPATLSDLFRSELWRGRDNLRVSLRSRPSLRELPGIGMPVGYLGSLGLVLLGWPFLGPVAPVLGAGGVLSLTLLRTARMVANARSSRPPPLRHILAVASVYEAARALALVVRIRHRRHGASGADSS